MRVVVVGATGNVGTSVLRALDGDPAVGSILGVARRRPAMDFAKTTWAEADITKSNLVPLFREADVVVHLAWLIQPARKPEVTRAVNVHGSGRVFAAVAEAEVPALVYASSVGAYSPGPKDRRVDESWPTRGIKTSFYSRQKGKVEGMLDAFEREHPAVRVVRIRPGLIFKREAASEIKRLFVGPLLPNAVLQKGLIPVVPKIDILRFQAVHGSDVGEAYRLAIVRDVHGPFNIAAEPVLDSGGLARLLDARQVPIPPSALRRAAEVSYKLRLQPSEPGWVDMAFQSPLMDTTRAREQLGWAPRYSSGEALIELLDGMKEGAGSGTPPLSKRGGLGEILQKAPFGRRAA
jgi:nucleoside-diphosphate-sugar epimerase